MTTRTWTPPRVRASDAVAPADARRTPGAPFRSSVRGPSRGCATARPRSCRPTSSSRSISARCACCPRSGWTSSTPTPAKSFEWPEPRVEQGSQRVRFDPDMVTELIRTAPSTFTLHARNPAHDIELGGDWIAFGTVGSPPNVADLDRGRRIGNRADYQNLLRLAQSLSAVHFLSGYPVEPVDLHHGVRHLHATFDALTLMDKVVHCYSLGRQRNIDVLEMVRIARGVDAATHRARAIGVHRREFELATPARHADAPGDHGVRSPRPGRLHHAVHARGGDGAGDPRRRARRAERRGPRRHGPDPGRQTGRSRHLRRLHLERRHAVGRAGVRHTGVHADGVDRRPAGAALRRSVPLVERLRRERARRPVRLRVGVLVVGRDHGRRQHAAARRRLDGGRACTRATRR